MFTRASCIAHAHARGGPATPNFIACGCGLAMSGHFPWLCCSVCPSTSVDCSCLYITKLCAHFVCDKCRAKWPHNSCPTCKKQPVEFKPGGALNPYLDDLIDSTIHLQKILELQNKHYLASCSKEREVLSGRYLHDISVAKLEKETLQVEHKCKQMREWKSTNAALLANYDCVFKALRSSY